MGPESRPPALAVALTIDVVAAVAGLRTRWEVELASTRDPGSYPPGGGRLHSRSGAERTTGPIVSRSRNADCRVTPYADAIVARFVTGRRGPMGSGRDDRASVDRRWWRADCRRRLRGRVRPLRSWRLLPHRHNTEDPILEGWHRVGLGPAAARQGIGAPSHVFRHGRQARPRARGLHPVQDRGLQRGPIREVSPSTRVVGVG